MSSQNIGKRFKGNLPATLSLFSTATMLGLAATSARAQIANPISAFPIEADGAYTGSNPTSNAQWGGEWSDITPAWFASNETTGATPVTPGDPSANSLLFAGLGRDTPTSPPELYLMYDYLGRTAIPTGPNQFMGSISFPLTIGGVSEQATVTFQTVSNYTINLLVLGDFTDVTVSLNGGAPVEASTLGLEAGDTFGVTPVDSLWGVTTTSPFHTTSHELMELGVPLDIAPGFGSTTPNSPFPAGGQGNGSGYSPNPAFWSSNLSDNNGDPPASGGLFLINPDGSTDITPHAISVPEPTTLGIVAVVGTMLSTRRRRAAR